MPKIHALLTPQFIKYIIVGGTAFVAEYASFFVLYAMLHIWLALGNAVSFCIGLLTSFVLNRLWSFKHKEGYTKPMAHQFLFYTMLSLFNLALTVGLVEVFKQFGVDPLLGKVFASAITSIWNYALFKLFIFKHGQLDA